MDVPRQDTERRKRVRRLMAGGALIVLIGAAIFVASTKRPAPKIAKSVVEIGEVKRGDMLQDVRAFGYLVAKDLMYVPAPSDGRVDAVKVLPGTRVSKDDVILVLSNPELRLDITNGEARLRESDSARKTTQARFDSQYMEQRATAAAAKSAYLEAKLQADRDEDLFKEKLVPDLARQRSRLRADAAKERLDIEEDRLVTLKREAEAQLAAADAQIDQNRAALEFARRRNSELEVRAGRNGVMRDLLVKVGQQVNAGTSLAVVVDTTQLKAEVKVAETQLKDIARDQKATVDTHNGMVAGHVTRIDPTVTEGTVTIDIGFDEPLPEGACPELSVTATVEIARFTNVLYVNRPAQTSANSTAGLFRLSPDGEEAFRTPVQLGASAATTIEVLSGLSEGDKVILSDMSRWDQEDCLRIE